MSEQRCFGRKTEWWPAYYYGMISLASGLNLVAFGVCLYTEMAMLSRRAVRKNTFNLYVIFLLLPDTLNNLIQSLQGWYRAADCGKTTPLMSDLFDANIFFYYFCNFSMSCLVAYELHALLERSRRHVRTGPPSVKRTLLQIAGVYGLAMLFTLWGILDFSWSWWYREKSKFGSPPGGVFNQIEAISMIAALMLTFVIFVLAIRFNIWRKNLIPTRGRTRVVALFFQHIVGVFLVFYVPSIALLAYSTQLKGHTSSAYFWIERSSQLLAALQALATVYVAVQKPDIRNAFYCGKETAKPGQRWSVFGSSNNGSDTRRWRFSTFRGSRKASDTTRIGRTASQTQRVTGQRPAEREDESSEGLPPPHGSSEFVSGNLASLPLFRSSEWAMDDVYENTQISSGVGEDDDKNDVEAIEGDHCHPTAHERQLGQRLVASTIESEEIVFGQEGPDRT